MLSKHMLIHCRRTCDSNLRPPSPTLKLLKKMYNSELRKCVVLDLLNPVPIHGHLGWFLIAFQWKRSEPARYKTSNIHWIGYTPGNYSWRQVWTFVGVSCWHALIYVRPLRSPLRLLYNPLLLKISHSITFLETEAGLHVLGNFWKLGKFFQNLGTFCFWANFSKFWAKMKIFWAKFRNWSFLYCTACLHLERTSERRVHCENSSKKSTCDFFHCISFAICTSRLTFLIMGIISNIFLTNFLGMWILLYIFPHLFGQFWK